MRSAQARSVVQIQIFGDSDRLGRVRVDNLEAFWRLWSDTECFGWRFRTARWSENNQCVHYFPPKYRSRKSLNFYQVVFWQYLWGFQVVSGNHRRIIWQLGSTSGTRWLIKYRLSAARMLPGVCPRHEMLAQILSVYCRNILIQRSYIQSSQTRCLAELLD